MPKISALIHAANHERTLGRALESLRPCDQILVVLHSSTDQSRKIAKEYGATIKKAVIGVDDGAYAHDCKHQWVLCLLPNEALSEALEAALFEWKETDPARTAGYSIAVRKETRKGWRQLGREMRLVNRDAINWTGALPGKRAGAAQLKGDILRFGDDVLKSK
jgi:glycosyltransferase involved in cell wall biosynthesis